MQITSVLLCRDVRNFVFKYTFFFIQIVNYINYLVFQSVVPGPGNGENDNGFMMVALFAVIGMLLYALRPRSLRQSEDGAKARDSDSVSTTNLALVPLLCLLFNVKMNDSFVGFRW